MLLAVALVAMLVLTPAVVLAFVGRLEVMQFAPLVTSCSASAGVDPSSAAGGVLLVLLVGMPVLQHTSRQSLLKAKWERRVFGSEGVVLGGLCTKLGGSGCLWTLLLLEHPLTPLCVCATRMRV